MPRVKRFDENEVLAKAMHLFWKRGYAATSIQDLVDHLGINRASIYDTYGDKERLFFLAFQQYRKTNTEFLASFLEKEENVKQGFRRLFEMTIQAAVTDADKKGCFVVNTTTELIPGDHMACTVLETNKHTFETLFHNYLRQGETLGQFGQGKDLKAIAKLLFLLYNGLQVISKIKPNKKELIGSLNLVLGLLD